MLYTKNIKKIGLILIMGVFLQIVPARAIEINPCKLYKSLFSRKKQRNTSFFNKKLIIVGGVFATLCLGGIYWYFQKRDNADATSPSNPLQKIGQWILKTYRLAKCKDEYERVDTLIKYGYEYDINQEFKRACWFNNLEGLQLFIDNGVSVNISDPDGMTFLHAACEINNIELVQLLIDNGANVNIPNKDGLTPLYEACMNNNLELVQLLIDNGANVNIPNKDGITLLSFACLCNQPKLAQLLLKCGANINKSDRFGITPLYLACIDNKKELPLENSVDINVFTQRSIYSAYYNDKLPLVQLLLENGAQVTDKILNDIKNQEIIRLLHNVYDFQHSDNQLQFILQHMAKELVKIACSASFVQMLKSEIQVKEAIFYQLHEYIPDILSKIFEVDSLQVDDLMDCIIEKTNICLTQQMQERLSEYKDLLISAPKRFNLMRKRKVSVYSSAFSSKIPGSCRCNLAQGKETEESASCIVFSMENRQQNDTSHLSRMQREEE